MAHHHQRQLIGEARRPGLLTQFFDDGNQILVRRIQRAALGEQGKPQALVQKCLPVGDTARLSEVIAQRLQGTDKRTKAPQQQGIRALHLRQQQALGEHHFLVAPGEAQ